MLVSSTILLVTIACIIVHFLQWYLKKLKLYGNVPCMKSWHLIGDVPRLRGNNMVVYKNLMRYVDEYREKGILCLWFGPNPNLLIFKDDYVQDAMGNMQNLDKHSLYKFLRPWLGCGIMTSPKERWVHSSKILKPSFNYNILNCFVNRIENQTNKVLNEMDKLVGEREINISTYMKKFLHSTITEVAVGLTEGGELIEYTNSTRTITQIFSRRLISPWLWTDFIFNKTPAAKIFRKCISQSHSIINKIIDDRSVIYKENMNKSEEERAQGKEKVTLLDTLFKVYYNGKVDKTFMREEMENIVFGGTDTVITSLQWTILLVASHPEVQKKLHDEIDVFYRETEEINAASLKKLLYLECIIKESLRLYSPVPVVGRVAGEDFKIGNYNVKKGADISIFLSGLHRDPKHFTDPSTFNPDRFLTENVKHAFAFIPFAAGPRVCIGVRLAYMELKIVLSRFFQRFHVEATQKIEDIPPSMEMVLRPTKDIYAILTHRQSV
ncbi:cytochrome P450 4V2-like [Octopus sinensis]|uniref:Cytochrome P450 4V2-like n=1 Tax=Octopus sinensis TaxID=2607531 RepID=A0A6P7SG79_9MOLL|nr:cytochrome P450 4V2-like [Octopus sinensis]